LSRFVQDANQFTKQMPPGGSLGGGDLDRLTGACEAKSPHEVRFSDRDDRNGRSKEQQGSAIFRQRQLSSGHCHKGIDQRIDVMQSQQQLSWLSIMALVLASMGCCCVQGVPGNCGSCGSCGMGGLAAAKSCSGGCGETYVDEWISQPPCVDRCCAGDCRPVRSLLQALWGSKFVGGCDGCGGCDDNCSGSCGYASAGGSGCTTCGGNVDMPMASGGCNCGGGGGSGGGTVFAEPLEPQVQHMPTYRSSPQAQIAGEPRMVPGSYRVSEPRRLSGTLAAERINPARQKIDAKRATYSH
jgi:hypothetical protein